MCRAKLSYRAQTPAPSGTSYDPVLKAVEQMLAQGNTASDDEGYDCNNHIAPYYSSLQRNCTLPNTGPGKDFKPVARIWCKDGAGQTVALHDADIVIMSYEDLPKYMDVQRCVVEFIV